MKVSRVCQTSYWSVSKFWRCFKKFPRCFRKVSWVPQKDFKGVSRSFHRWFNGSFKRASRIFHRSFKKIFKVFNISLKLFWGCSVLFLKVYCWMSLIAATRAEGGLVSQLRQDLVKYDQVMQSYEKLDKVLTRNSHLVQNFGNICYTRSYQDMANLFKVMP